MSNKDRANKTYVLLQQRKRDKERIKETDYMDHVVCNIDKVMKKNYRRKSGQF
ncbi:hypothetical protein ACYJ2V_000208 [Clostridium botulinum]|uniref:hypothetical protein n=1 Tax=Clostridium botulinum TaxID=1491 RepID=UPI001474A40F|nr:hypothetical protein [Clostridium botulinum]MBY6878493.1 hypothetical protein [Clostridium botulinum]